MGELSLREAYGRALADYGAVNSKVVCVDVDTSASTLTHFFAKRFPERFVNVGIAEPCMVDVAVGLALGGYIPFANAFAALVALRAAEQIRTCVCYARTNVKIASSYAGLSDFKDGPTHHSIVDIAFMRALPDMTVIVPADAAEMAKWVPVIAEYDGPVYLRISRAATLPVHNADLEVRIGKSTTLRPGNDVTIVAAGSMTGRAMLAAEKLDQENIQARVICMSSIKPLDVDVLLQAAEETHGIVTAEEHSIIGGLGGAVAEALSDCRPTRVQRVGIHDQFTRTALDPETLMDAYGLAVSDIVSAAKKVVFS
jgi:transketolase